MESRRLFWICSRGSATKQWVSASNRLAREASWDHFDESRSRDIECFFDTTWQSFCNSTCSVCLVIGKEKNKQWQNGRNLTNSRSKVFMDFCGKTQKNFGESDKHSGLEIFWQSLSLEVLNKSRSVRSRLHHWHRQLREVRHCACGHNYLRRLVRAFRSIMMPFLNPGSCVLFIQYKTLFARIFTMRRLRSYTEVRVHNIVTLFRSGVHSIFAIAGRITHIMSYTAASEFQVIYCIASVLLPHVRLAVFLLSIRTQTDKECLLMHGRHYLFLNCVRTATGCAPQF